MLEGSTVLPSRQLGCIGRRYRDDDLMGGRVVFSLDLSHDPTRDVEISTSHASKADMIKPITCTRAVLVRLTFYGVF